MRPSNRVSSIACVTSRFTQRDAIAAGDRMMIIQSHRASAAPISSCHCAAPRMPCSLNQIVRPWPRRTTASRFRNRCLGKSEIEKLQSDSSDPVVYATFGLLGSFWSEGRVVATRRGSGMNRVARGRNYANRRVGRFGTEAVDIHAAVFRNLRILSAVLRESWASLMNGKSRKIHG